MKNIMNPRLLLCNIMEKVSKLESLLQMGIQLGSAATTFVILQLLAKSFGASVENDAFSTAFAVINQLSVYLIGIITVVWIPFFIKIIDKSTDEISSQHGNAALYMIICLSGSISLIIFFGADLIVWFSAKSMPHDGQIITTKLLRLCAPLFLLQGAAAIGAGVLNVQSRFLIAASGRLTMNLTALAAALLLPILMMYSVAIGMVIGGVLYLLIIIWFCRGQLSLLLPRPLHYHQSILLLGNDVLALAVQACFGVAGIMVFRRCANDTGVGANTALTLAVGLTAPLILAISQIVVRAYPAISRAANTAYRNQKVLQDLLRKVVYQNIVICLPVSIMVLFLGRPACYVLFHTGAFDSSATNITADVLQVYGLSIFIYVTSFLFDRTLLVLGKLKVLVGLSALEFVILSVLAITISAQWSVVVLPWAPVIAICLKCLASGIYLYATKFLWLRPRLRPFLGLCISVTVLFSSMLILNIYMFSNMAIDRLTLAFHVLTAALLGFIVFALVQAISGNSIIHAFLMTEGDQETISQKYRPAVVKKTESGFTGIPPVDQM